QTVSELPPPGSTQMHTNSITTPDQGRREAARDVASLPRQESPSRSSGGGGGSVYNFDPNDDQFDRQLKQQLYEEPSTVGRILGDAGQTISNLAIPPAEARSRE